MSTTPVDDEMWEATSRYLDVCIEKINAARKASRDAPTETGWCKIRDAFVIPDAINIGMYVLKVVLEKAAANDG